MTRTAKPPTHSASLLFPPKDAWHAEGSPQALLRGSLIQAHRILTKWGRDPVTLLQALIYPAIMVLLFWLVLDQSITAHSGTGGALGMVPMVALIGAMSGASISGLNLRRERMTGLLGKMWLLPVHRGSAMVGRLLAEAVRVVVTVVLILLVGTTVGFRIETGLPGAIAVVAVAVAFGLSFSIMVTSFALLGGSSRIVEWTAICTNLAMFFNSGFVPVSAYPGWLQPVVRYQPVSCGVDAMRALAAGHAITEPLLLTLGWSTLLLAVFIKPALAGYRRAAMRD